MTRMLDEMIAGAEVVLNYDDGIVARACRIPGGTVKAASADTVDGALDNLETALADPERRGALDQRVARTADEPPPPLEQDTASRREVLRVYSLGGDGLEVQVSPRVFKPDTWGMVLADVLETIVSMSGCRHPDDMIDDDSARIRLESSMTGPPRVVVTWDGVDPDDPDYRSCP